MNWTTVDRAVTRWHANRHRLALTVLAANAAIAAVVYATASGFTGQVASYVWHNILARTLSALWGLL